MRRKPHTFNAVNVICTAEMSKDEPKPDLASMIDRNATRESKRQAVIRMAVHEFESSNGRIALGASLESYVNASLQDAGVSKPATDAELEAAQRDDVTPALAALGIGVRTYKREFAKLVTGQDHGLPDATETQLGMIAQLLGMDDKGPLDAKDILDAVIKYINEREEFASAAKMHVPAECLNVTAGELRSRMARSDGKLVMAGAVLFDTAGAKTPPTRFLILKDGPLDWAGADYTLDEESANAVIAEFERHGAHIPIDYHHATKHAEDAPGTVKAPAAGWIRGLEYVKGEGLYAVDVEWTETATAEIAAKQFKYISPALFVDKSNGKPLTLHSVGLLNRPRTRKLPELLEAATG